MKYENLPVICAVNARTGTTLGEEIRVAQDWLSRSRGLLGRTALRPGEGLLIRPCNSIHMFFMKCAIDVLFLDKNGKVVGIRENLKPWRMAGELVLGHSVIELSEGQIEKKDIKIGDLIRFK